MIRAFVVGATAIAVGIGVSTIAPAIAAPPTAVPSPGYDQRLVESRRALGTSSYYHEGPVVVVPRGHRTYDPRYGRHRQQR
jgi:hypothetical protein